MARLHLILLLTLTLVGTLHAGSFFLRDEIEGFPPVVTDEEGPAENVPVGENGETGEETGGTEDNETLPKGEKPDLVKELEDFHCNPLEDLFEELVNSSAIDIYIDMMYDMGARPGVEDKEEMFSMLADVSGYNLMEHDGRHKLACALYGVKDIEGLAALMALPVNMVEMMYELWQDAFKENGGMEAINVYSKVAYEFSTWAMETGYPNMPLPKSVSVEDVRDLMREWQTAIFNLDMERNTHLMEMMDQGIAPLKIMPEYTAKILTSVQTTEEMMAKLCINKQAYMIYTHYGTGTNIQALLDLMVVVVRILNEFSDMGLFSLAS